MYNMQVETFELQVDHAELHMLLLKLWLCESLKSLPDALGVVCKQFNQSLGHIVWSGMFCHLREFNGTLGPSASIACMTSMSDALM